MRILLTGFGDFLENKENPSSLVLDLIEGDNIFKTVLPVSYKRSQEVLLDKIEEVKPDYVISMGLASNRFHLSLEYQAHNVMYSNSCDNDGEIKLLEKIDETKENSYFTSFDLIKLEKKLNEHSIKTRISLDCGGYVCNTVYFTSLSHENKGYKGLFIHLPPLKVMSLEKVKEALDIILDEIKTDG